MGDKMTIHSNFDDFEFERKMKETKKPVNFHDDQRDTYYECPVCHETVKMCQKYCGNCGQRLGWDLEEMGRC